MDGRPYPEKLTANPRQAVVAPAPGADAATKTGEGEDVTGTTSATLPAVAPASTASAPAQAAAVSQGGDADGASAGPGLFRVGGAVKHVHKKLALDWGPLPGGDFPHLRAASAHKCPQCGSTLYTHKTEKGGAFACDNCGGTQARGATLWSCRACNYDVCGACNMELGESVLDAAAKKKDLHFIRSIVVLCLDALVTKVEMLHFRRRPGEEEEKADGGEDEDEGEGEGAEDEDDGPSSDKLLAELAPDEVQALLSSVEHGELANMMRDRAISGEVLALALANAPEGSLVGSSSSSSGEESESESEAEAAVVDTDMESGDESEEEQDDDDDDDDDEEEAEVDTDEELKDGGGDGGDADQARREEEERQAGAAAAALVRAEDICLPHMGTAGI